MATIKFLAFDGAPEQLFDEGKNRLMECFPTEKFNLSSQNPDILYFISGGSEREALTYAKTGKFLLLVAFEENNSYAAATEVKAYFDSIGQDCQLADIKNENDRGLIQACIDA
jgi:hypothetical protein